MKLTAKQELFLENFEKKAANIKQTCAAIGISRETYYAWCKSDKSDIFKKKVDAVLEGMIDDAESQLHLNMMDGKETSLIFFLKTRAKHRGYVEKQEMEHSGQMVQRTIIVNPTKKPSE